MRIAFIGNLSHVGILPDEVIRACRRSLEHLGSWGQALLPALAKIRILSPGFWPLIRRFRNIAGSNVTGFIVKAFSR
jgi:hypothetical protein